MTSKFPANKKRQRKADGGEESSYKGGLLWIKQKN